MGPWAGLDGCGKSRPHRDLIPGPLRSRYTDYAVLTPMLTEDRQEKQLNAPTRYAAEAYTKNLLNSLISLRVDTNWRKTAFLL